MQNRIIFLIPLFLLLVSVGRAQMPRTISFQGVLTDASGALVSDGDHQLALLLYDAATNGNIMYSENQTVPVTRGLFNVSIGVVNPLPTTLLFNRAYYLGVVVDGGNELSPRTPLTAVPYALFAERARMAESLSPDVTGVVTSVNGRDGDVILVGAGSTTVTQSGNTVTINSAGGTGSGLGELRPGDGSVAVVNGTGPVATVNVADQGISSAKLADGSVTRTKLDATGAQSGQALMYDGASVVWQTPAGGGGAGVSSVNSLTGALTITGGGGTTVTTNGSTLTITAPGGGGTGVQGVQSTDNSLAVSSPNGPTATLNIASNGVTTQKLADGAVTAAKLNTQTAASTGKVLTATATGLDWQTAAGFTLPYSGSVAFTLAPAFKVTNTAAQSAIYGESAAGNGVTGLTSNTIGVAGISTGNGSGVVGMSTGTGRGGYFIINNAASNTAALEATTTGTGDGIVGHSIGHNGVAGLSTSATENGVYGGNDNGGNGVMGRCIGAGNAVIGYNGGAGRAGYFHIGSSSNSANAVEVVTDGTGHAGYFETSSTANHGETVEAVAKGVAGTALHGTSSKGIGVLGESAGNVYPAVMGLHNAGGNAVMGKCESGNGNAVVGAQMGTGQAADFYILNSSNNNVVVGGSTTGGGDVFSANVSGGKGIGVSSWTSGSGDAGRFEISNGSNVKNAIEAITSGLGIGILVDHTGATGSLAIFRSSGANKARIDKTGRGYFNGGTQNSGADVAEAFDVEGNRESYEPGDVLILSPAENRRVEKCSSPYSELVAGVFATKPGVLLTEMDIDAPLDKMVPMGIVGVIPTKVCTENGPIRVGDLLVTSSTPGCAMKADRAKAIPGTIIGKAMQSFSGALVGKINVLVNCR